LLFAALTMCDKFNFTKTKKARNAPFLFLSCLNL